MALSTIQKLLSLLISVPAVSTGIYYGTKKSNNLTSSPAETNSLISPKQTDDLIHKASKDLPKYCRVILSSRDLRHEVLLCFDLDKENHLNKTYGGGRYFASFFLLDKMHGSGSFSMKKINSLVSTLKKENVSWHGSSWTSQELRETTWQAFRRKKDIFNTPEMIEEVGLPFTIKYRLGYPQSAEEGFLFPRDGTAFMRRKNYDAIDRAVLGREALIIGSTLSKRYSWGDEGVQHEVENFDNIRPFFSDIHDPRLIDHKNNSKYQIVLDKSDKFWNAGGANNYDALPKTEFYAHKDFVCKQSENLFEGRNILDCSENN